MGEPVRAVLLILTGVAAGLVGSVAGVASLVAYPGLLAFGLAPLSANVTSTVANVFGGIGSSVSSGPELEGQADRVRRLAALAAVGALIGAALLLATPSDVFSRIVPVFIAVASLAVFVRPHPSRRAGVITGPDPAQLPAATFVLGVYAGYFGAAAGTAMVALLLYITGDTVPRANGVKNVTFLCANAVAAIAFSLFGPVSWLTVLPLGAGFLLGGRMGPPVMRRMPVRILRPLIALCGLGLAVRLGLSAWG